jgi:hypothetical protein
MTVPNNMLRGEAVLVDRKPLSGQAGWPALPDLSSCYCCGTESTPAAVKADDTTQPPPTTQNK